MLVKSHTLFIINMIFVFLNYTNLKDLPLELCIMMKFMPIFATQGVIVFQLSEVGCVNISKMRGVVLEIMFLIIVGNCVSLFSKGWLPRAFRNSKGTGMIIIEEQL